MALNTSKKDNNELFRQISTYLIYFFSVYIDLLVDLWYNKHKCRDT